MAQRIVSRSFPAADQLGIATGTALNQSTLTFSGQRGTVIVEFLARFNNAGAVAINEMALTVTGTAVVISLGQRVAWFDAVAGRRVTVVFRLLVTDPAAGSTLGVAAFLSAGTVDVLANSGLVTAESRPVEVGEGPVVTVS